MYNVEQMIAEGQAAISRHPRRSINVSDYLKLTKGDYDKHTRADRLYLFGIALGMRIAKAEMKKSRAAEERQRRGTGQRCSRSCK